MESFLFSVYQFPQRTMETDEEDYSNETLAESGLLLLDECWFLAHLDSPQKRIPLKCPLGSFRLPLLTPNWHPTATPGLWLPWNRGSTSHAAATSKCTVNCFSYATLLTAGGSLEGILAGHLVNLLSSCPHHLHSSLKEAASRLGLSFSSLVDGFIPCVPQSGEQRV